MNGPRLAVIVAVIFVKSAMAHDIPNARVDRSIQATIKPGLLTIDYEIGLSEITLTRDLRALTGALPGASRREWFDLYGKETGPLNAKGLLVSVDGEPVELRAQGFDLAIEDHLRFTFHFEGDIPPRGRIMIQDTNYASGEGTSRLAIKGVEGVAIQGDDLPEDVALISIKPIWQLSDADETRTSRVVVEYGPGVAKAPRRSAVSSSSKTPKETRPARAAAGLSRLLDRSTASGLGLWLMALGLGAAHAIQPGHGKSLVAAASIGQGGGWTRGFALALVITAAHIGGVLLVAAILLATRSSRYPDINQGLTHIAGYIIAAIGVWRIGRHLGGHGEHDGLSQLDQSDLGKRSVIGLGLAGGIVPCWDAVILILLSEAVDRLALGIALLTAFSLGMATILTAVGVAASHLRGWVGRNDSDGVWVKRLGLLSASSITAIGLYLLMT